MTGIDSHWRPELVAEKWPEFAVDWIHAELSVVVLFAVVPEWRRQQ